MSNRILAVVVTYNPDASLMTNLIAIAEQATALVVIDNASTNVEDVANAVEMVGGRLVRNEANLGIAAALNQAVKIAQTEGFDWLATFDQDSLPSPGMINNLTQLYDAHPLRAIIAIMSPRHEDRILRRDYAHFAGILGYGPGWRSLRTTITSGNLVRTEIFSLVGMYDEEFFIDLVDHDFCLKCRSKGLLIIESTTAKLDHLIGAPKIIRIGKFRFGFANQSPIRRYYMTRNSLRVTVRHFLTDPLWSLTNAAFLCASTIVALTVEDERLRKAAAIAAGVRDFFAGRLGPKPARAAGA